jgi:hypothetical protein
MIITIASLVSSLAFVMCAILAGGLVLMGDFAASIAYGILAAWWFILMVIFGYIFIQYER